MTSTGGTSLPVRASSGLRLLVASAAFGACDPSASVDARDRAIGALAAERPSEAAPLFLQACDGGDAPACDALGALVSAGRGVPADPGRAEALHRQACDAGVGAGCANLGSLLAAGGGAAKDSEAADLFRRACLAGEVAGCSNLGVMYGLGRGVAKDSGRARFLDRWACDGGDALACKRVGP